MLLLLLNYVVLRALWKIDVYLISTLVNKSLYYYYYYYYYYNINTRIWYQCNALVLTVIADVFEQCIHFSKSTTLKHFNDFLWDWFAISLRGTSPQWCKEYIYSPDKYVHTLMMKCISYLVLQVYINRLHDHTLVCNNTGF